MAISEILDCALLDHRVVTDAILRNSTIMQLDGQRVVLLARWPSWSVARTLLGLKLTKYRAVTDGAYHELIGIPVYCPWRVVC